MACHWLVKNTTLPMLTLACHGLVDKPVLTWADSFAGYVLWMLMIYLTDVWKLKYTHAAAIINIWMGSTHLLPIPFTHLAEIFLGNFFPLLLSTLSYTTGLALLWMSTPPVLAKTYGNCTEYKPECIGNHQKVLFFTGLALIAVGMSGTTTFLGAFAIDQEDEEDAHETNNEGAKLLCLSSSCFCLSITISTLMPIAGILVVEFVKSWATQYEICTIITMVSTLVFLSGVCSYKYLGPEGSTMTTSYVISMIPMWLTMILLGVVSSTGNTYFLEQAKHLNPKVGHIKVPLIILLWFYDQGKKVFSKFFVRIFACCARTADDPDMVADHVPIPGFLVAMIFSILCCITAASLETRRLGVVKAHGLVDKPEERIPMSIFWLLPQFAFLGAMDGIFNISFSCLYDEDNPSKSKSILLLTEGVFGAGIMGSALSVYIVGKISEQGGKKTSWFQNTLNLSHLDNYYWVLAALCAVNLVMFMVIAIFHGYKVVRSITKTNI